MKPFHELTYRGQALRIRRLLERTLPSFGLDGSRLRLVQHAENTTFRVDAPVNGKAVDGYTPGRYLARVHRPEYHSAAEIRSELMWLRALRDDLGLMVPEPVPALAGGLVAMGAADGLPCARPVSVLRWMPGTRRENRPHPAQIERVGRLMARLHEHARSWVPPHGFTRGEWRWDGLFGKDFGFGISEKELWSHVPQSCETAFRDAAGITRRAMDELGVDTDGFGLIHADLHLGNLLFDNGQVKPIDFDDCGYGYYAFDFAVVVDNLRHYGESNGLEEALFRGYRGIRAVPESVAEYLDTFVAARQISIGLWVFGMAAHNPAMQKWTGHVIEKALPAIQGFLKQRTTTHC